MTDKQLDKAVREYMQHMQYRETYLDDEYAEGTENDRVYLQTRIPTPGKPNDECYSLVVSPESAKQFYLDREQYAKQQAEIAALEARISIMDWIITLDNTGKEKFSDTFLDGTDKALAQDREQLARLKGESND